MYYFYLVVATTDDNSGVQPDLGDLNSTERTVLKATLSSMETERVANLLDVSSGYISNVRGDLVESGHLKREGRGKFSATDRSDDIDLEITVQDVLGENRSSVIKETLAESSVDEIAEQTTYSGGSTYITNVRSKEVEKGFLRKTDKRGKYFAGEALVEKLYQLDGIEDPDIRRRVLDSVELVFGDSNRNQIGVPELPETEWDSLVSNIEQRRAENDESELEQEIEESSERLVDELDLDLLEEADPELLAVLSSETNRRVIFNLEEYRKTNRMAKDVEGLTHQEIEEAAEELDEHGIIRTRIEFQNFSKIDSNGSMYETAKEMAESIESSPEFFTEYILDESVEEDKDSGSRDNSVYIAKFPKGQEFYSEFEAMFDAVIGEPVPDPETDSEYGENTGEADLLEGNAEDSLENIDDELEEDSEEETDAELPDSYPKENELDEYTDMDDLFEMLSVGRRRTVIRVMDNLRDKTPLNLSKVVEVAAVVENEGINKVSELGSKQRKRAYIALQQTHLDRLDDYGAVEFNKNRGLIDLPEEELGQDRFDELTRFTKDEIYPENEKADDEYFESLFEDDEGYISRFRDLLPSFRR